MKAEREAEHDANKAKWKERYDAASPEEKKHMDERMEHRKERRKEWMKEHHKEGGMMHEGEHPMMNDKAATPSTPK